MVYKNPSNLSDEKLLVTDKDTEADLQNEEPKKTTKLILILDGTMLLCYIATGLTILILRDLDCSVDNFLLAWLSLQAILLIIATIVEFFMPRTVIGSFCNRIYSICDILLILSGITGVIGYATACEAEMKGICGQFMWDAMLGWSITPVFVIFIADVIICKCY